MGYWTTQYLGLHWNDSYSTEKLQNITVLVQSVTVALKRPVVMGGTYVAKCDVK